MSEPLPTLVIEKFWDSIEKTNFCWNWKGFIRKNGSPYLSISQLPLSKVSKLYSARLISLALVGKEPPKFAMVSPLACLNKLCVNPDHLAYDTESRFWSKVQKISEPNGCWVWIGGQDQNMYGSFGFCKEGKYYYPKAHVYSWQLYTGRPVPKGLFVCHKCDHPYCVNPDHLFIGTATENNKDRDDKGRQAKGESQGHAKLTEMKVKEIRELHLNGVSIAKLAIQFGVGKTTIKHILNRRRWKHVA